MSHINKNPTSNNTLNSVSNNTPNPGYKIIEHPADTGIVVCAAKIESLFEIAAEGMFSIICDTKSVAPNLKKTVTLSDDSELKLDDLLILWLEKLLYIHETTGILFSKFEITKLKIEQGITLLKADVYGEKIDLGRNKVFTAIKAPTYHKLKVVYDDCRKCWYGQVIFDV